MSWKRTMLIFALLILISLASIAQAADKTVPDPYTRIGDAINAAAAGQDRVVITVDSQTHGAYEPFVLDKAVPVLITAEGEVVVDAADTTSYAAQITDSGGSIEGLTLRGGTTGVVDVGSGSVTYCVVDDDGNAFSGGAVRIDAGGNFRSNSVDLTSGEGRAVVLYDSNRFEGGWVRDNTIEVFLDDATTTEAIWAGVYVDTPGSGVVSGNRIEFTGDKNGVGIRVSYGTLHIVSANTITGAETGILIGPDADGSNSVQYNVTEDCDDGVVLESQGIVSYNTFALTEADDCSGVTTHGIRINSGIAANVHNNLIYGTEVGIGCSGSYASLEHNIYWSDEACGSPADCTVSSSEVSEIEPAFCGDYGGTGTYTHRIDSAAAPDNNPWGQLVGAERVACAWGALERSASLSSFYSASEGVTVLEDVIVPSSMTLELGSGTALKFDDYDESGEGEQGALTELTVHGTLTVGSAGGSEAVLTGTAGSPAKGDWGGVTLDSCSVATITNTGVSGAQIAFLAQDTASVTLSDVTVNNAYYLVAAYDTADVEASEVTGTGLDYGFFLSGSSHLDAEDCDLTVGTDGVRVFSFLDALDACNITAGSHGLYVGGNGEAEVASTQTTIQGGVAGVFCTSGTATLSGPTIQNSETGIWATGSGDLSMLSGVIEDCDWGAWVDSGGRLTLGQYNGSAAESTQVLVQGCGTNGVGIDSDEDNELEQVRVEGGSDQAWVGIHLLPGSAASVTRCSVAGATGSSAVGILVETEADLLAPKVTGITGNVASGICVDADSTVAVAIDSVTYADSHWRRPKVQDCYYGIDVAATARPVIRATTVDTCRTDVHISPTAVPDLGYNTAGQKGYNVIQRAVSLLAGSRLTRVGGVPDVPAEQNYWGSSTPDGSKISSWVDYLPYLQNQPYAPLSLSDGVSLVAVERPLVGPAYPMPFANRVQIPLYVAAVREPVEVAVFDVQGRWVKTLASGPLASGEHMVTWDGWTGTGERAPSGVYFLKVQVGAKTAAQKLVKTN